MTQWTKNFMLASGVASAVASIYCCVHSTQCDYELDDISNDIHEVQVTSGTEQTTWKIATIQAIGAYIKNFVPDTSPIDIAILTAIYPEFADLH